MFPPFFFFLFSFSLSSFHLNPNRHQKEICSVISTSEKCANPHSDVEATQMSFLNTSKVPGDLSSQKIQKKKVLHAGISEQNGLNLITGFPSKTTPTYYQRSLNLCSLLKFLLKQLCIHMQLEEIIQRYPIYIP